MDKQAFDQGYQEGQEKVAGILSAAHEAALIPGGALAGVRTALKGGNTQAVRTANYWANNPAPSSFEKLMSKHEAAMPKAAPTRAIDKYHAMAPKQRAAAVEKAVVKNQATVARSGPKLGTQTPAAPVQAVSEPASVLPAAPWSSAPAADQEAPSAVRKMSNFERGTRGVGGWVKKYPVHAVGATALVGGAGYALAPRQQQAS